VAFVAKDAAQTYVVAHGEKSTVLETWEASLAYTPGNQVVYNATVSTSTGGTMSGWFVDRSPIKLQGIGSSTVMPPTFTADAAHAAYSIGEAICVDGVYGPQFYRVFSPRFSADGRVIAYVAEISTGGGGASRTKKAVVVGSTPGTRYDDIAGSPLLSSDGRVLAYIAKRGQKWLVVHGTKTGEEFDAIPTRLYDVDQPVMSSDGKILAYTAERGGQKVVVVNGKEVDNQPNLGAPAISADGKSVSYGFVSGPYFIWKTVPVPGR
jgi:Tol biopolymer transport system component